LHKFIVINILAVKAFMFGGDPSVPIYVLCLLFEGSASCVIVTLLLMLLWNNKYKAD